MSMDRALGDTIYLMFTTRAFGTGAPTTLSGTPVISAYENSSITQITAGITLGVDHDGVTGLNLMTIVASGANGYSTAKDYNLVITTGTVDSVSVVGEVVGEFSLSLSAAAVDLGNGTDGLGAIKAETALIVADTDELQGDWANAGRLDAILDSRMAEASINTTGGAVDTVTTVTNLHASAATATALAAVDTVVDGIQADLDNGTDGLGAIKGAVDAIQVDVDSMGITKNAIFSNFEFPMVLTSDHYTAATAKTVTGEKSIDGAGFVAIAGSIAEVGSGVYQCDLLAADTNGDSITYKFSAADCDDSIISILTRA